FAYKLKQMYHLPAFPYIYTASLLNKMVNGWYFSDANPLKAVSNCTKPMLFIHGESDTYVPTWMVYKLYDAKPMPKDLWTLPG
ncbi:MAG: alpha/beta hydrolase, partial [Porphyromonadaceae bacterium]|nr:alpha/beta hydrolase [Porphyromonadaceae bacterium]